MASSAGRLQVNRLVHVFLVEFLGCCRVTLETEILPLGLRGQRSRGDMAGHARPAGKWGMLRTVQQSPAIRGSRMRVVAEDAVPLLDREAGMLLGESLTRRLVAGQAEAGPLLFEHEGIRRGMREVTRLALPDLDRLVSFPLFETGFLIAVAGVA